MNPVDLAVFLSVGMALSLFGGGGAIILIPYMKNFLGMSMDHAALLSMLTIGANTGVQSVVDRKKVQWRAVIVFSLISIPATTLASLYLAPVVADSVRMLCFGVFTLTVAALMFFPLKPRSGETHNSVAIGLAAAATGVLCGLVGVGGGIFIAPALSVFYRVPLKEAVKSSLAIVAVQSLIGLSSYLYRGVRVPLSFALMMLVTVGLGILLGRWMKSFISEKQLKRGFAFFLIGIGTWVILRP
ncbi:MAG: sulfite exporter TauE/SafE family protein [Planctomycetota bacterium]|jgi:hypothetical protein|nr:sulfite exporter TauE/SafE family protein [Planctomycetota bacterium]